MPKKMPEYLNYFLQDCLQWDSQFSTKNLFGGYAVYKNWKVFCLYLMDTIYFKVDENNRADYEERNSKPFSYTKKSWEVSVMAYFELPEEILENKEELDIWINKSLLVKSNTKSKHKSKKDVKLDKEILEALLEIPVWKVSTYKILADKFWVHSRRIASAMKMNKEPEVFPCYKIISHSRKLSGYSWPDWVNSKIRMLEADWIKIVDWMIDKKYIYNY